MSVGDYFQKKLVPSVFGPPPVPEPSPFPKPYSGLVVPASPQQWEMAQSQNVSPRLSLIAQLRARLFQNLDEHGPFNDLHVVGLSSKIVIFCVVRDDYVVMEDDPGLYPSDKLIAALRLLM